MRSLAPHPSLSSRNLTAIPRQATLLLRAPRRAIWILRQEQRYWQLKRYIAPSYRKARPYSMLPDGRLLQLAIAVRDILENHVPGNLVECGVWRGGASFLMADLLRRHGATDRKVWMFDSFEGHRPPEPIDGAAALAYAKNADRPENYYNCRVDVTDVEQTAHRLGLSAYTAIVKGWFENTLPSARAQIGPISVLRIDCDWYQNVRYCLEMLYDQVTPNGYVIIDDYYDYDGCAIAVHEFLAERKLPHRLTTDQGLVYFRK